MNVMTRQSHSVDAVTRRPYLDRVTDTTWTVATNWSPTDLRLQRQRHYRHELGKSADSQSTTTIYPIYCDQRRLWLDVDGK